LYFEGLGPLEHRQGGGSPRKKLLKFIAKKIIPEETSKISRSDANVQAELLLQLAARKGLPAAQYNIGVFYIGHNSPYSSLEEADFERQWKEEETKAFEYTRLAALQGDAEAIYNLAVMYDLGSGVKESREEANRLYKLSASKGFELAKKVYWLNSL
jgi:TPR repeat protein